MGGGLLPTQAPLGCWELFTANLLGSGMRYFYTLP